MTTMDSKKNLPVGFMDSGVGGLSVLRESVRMMPNEDYLYFGDSLNAPYGTKTNDEILKLTKDAAEKLVNIGIKALVVACNTATSIAIKDLRDTYPDLPVIGVEPAIKPAVVCNQGGRIIVMATPVTVREEKFRNLLDLYKDEAEIVPLGLDGLMEFVEYGNFDPHILFGYLNENLLPHLTPDTESIVLGCTHYPFLKPQLEEFLEENGFHNVALIDGSKGTSSQLKRRLIEKDLLNDKNKQGKITILNSSSDEKMIELSKKLLNLDY